MSDYSFLLPFRDHFSGEAFARLQRFTHAVCPDTTGRGLVPALSHAISWLSDLSANQDVSLVEGLVLDLKRTIEELQSVPNLESRFFNAPDEKSCSIQLFNFFRQQRHDLSEESKKRLRSAYGLALIHALAHQTEISGTFADGWRKIQRSSSTSRGAVSHWRELGQSFPVTTEEVKQALLLGYANIVNDFLKDWHRILQARISGLTPNLNVGEPTSNAEVQQETMPPALSAYPQELSSCQILEVEEELDHAVPLTHSFVRWQWERANNSASLDAAGIGIGWDFLTLHETRHYLLQFAAALDQPDQESYALLAIVSFVSGLPIQHALNLPLYNNGDKWLDVKSGLVCWDLQQLIDRQPYEKFDASSGYRPDSIVRIPLPSAAAKVLQSLFAQIPAAGILQDLTAKVTREPKELISFFKQFLKQDSEFTHACTVGRLSRSFGNAILQVTNSDVLAALISGAFELCAPAQLNYLCVAEQLIQETVRCVYQEIGLGVPVFVSDPHYIGSPKRPTEERIAASFSKLQSDYGTLVGSISARSDIASVLNKVNRMTERLLWAFVFLTAHRGTQLRRLNFAALTYSEEFIVINDKNSSEYGSTRLIPLSGSVRALLRAHLGNLASLCARLRTTDKKVTAQLEQLLAGKKPTFPLFFFLHMENRKIRLTPCRSSDLGRISREYIGSDKNCGRHFWLSMLTQRQADPIFARILLGHFRQGAEPFGIGGGIAPAQALDSLRREMDDVIEEMKIVKWRSLKTYECRRSSNAPVLPHVLPPPGTQSYIARYADAVNSGSSLSGFTEQGCPFDQYTVLGYAYINWIRDQLANNRLRPTPWAGIALSLMVMDGFTCRIELEAVLTACRSNIYRFGRGTLIEYERQSKATAVLAPHPVTRMFIRQAASQPHFPCTTVAISEAVAWLKAADPLNYQEEGVCAAIDRLVACVARWIGICLPPFIVAASDGKLDTACLSIRSLARIATGKPCKQTATAAALNHAQGYGSYREPVLQQAQAIARIIAENGDNNKKYGEERARRTKCLREIDQWLENSGAVHPLCLDFLAWLRFELGGETVLPRHDLQVSSLSSYFATVYHHFLRLSHHSIWDYEQDDWLTLAAGIEETSSDHVRDQNLSKLRRLALYFAQRGADVPPVIWVKDKDARNLQPQARAASAYVSKRDIQRACEALEHLYSDRPWIGKRGGTKFTLLSEMPLRIGEANRLHGSSVSTSFSLVSITSSGFSHLKTKSSRRLLPISPGLSAAFESLMSDQKQGHGSVDFCFLERETCSFSEAEHLDRDFMDILRLQTGDASVRMHSLRGSAIARLVEPEFEHLVMNLYQGKVREADRAFRPVRSQWIRLLHSARVAGHAHPLTTLRYYLSIWPILKNRYLSQFDRDLKLNFDVLPCAGLLTSANARQLMSRAKRNTPTRQVSQVTLLEHALSSHANEPMDTEVLLQDNACPPPSTRSIQPTSCCASGAQDKGGSRYLWYLLKRCFLSRLHAAEQSSITLEEACRVDNTWYSLWGSDKDTGNDPSPISQCSKLKGHLKNHSADAIIQRVSTVTSTQDLLGAIRLTGSTLPAGHNHALVPLKTQLEAVLLMLPPPLTLNVLRPKAGSDAALGPLLRYVDPNVVLTSTKRRIANGCRVLITARDPNRQGPKADGIYTNIFLASCRAQLAILRMQTLGSKHA